MPGMSAWRFPPYPVAAGARSRARFVRRGLERAERLPQRLVLIRGLSRSEPRRPSFDQLAVLDDRQEGELAGALHSQDAHRCLPFSTVRGSGELSVA